MAWMFNLKSAHILSPNITINYYWAVTTFNVHKVLTFKTVDLFLPK